MEYPKRGKDCPHSEDCIWGCDGLCDRPKGWKCILDKE